MLLVDLYIHYTISLQEYIIIENNLCIDIADQINNHTQY